MYISNLKIQAERNPIKVFKNCSDYSYLNDKRFHKKKHESTVNYNQEIADKINSYSITEEELIKILGRKWKSNLATIGAFIESYQYFTSEKDVSALAVATTSKFMISLCGSKRNASNLIKLMCEIKLLTRATQIIQVEKLEFDEDGEVINSVTENKEIEYSYKRGIACEYYYSKSIQRKVKEVIDKYKIVIKQNIKENIKNIENIDRESILDITKGETFVDFDKIRINSSLKIPCTEKDMDKIVLAGLYENYPQLLKYQKMADEMNKDLNAANQITFEPKITYSKSKKYINKIGIRATNPLVSAKKDYFLSVDDVLDPNFGTKEHKEFYGKFKEDVLEEQLGSEYYEFDVKSSVPRVTKLLNTGIWEDNRKDIYEEIYENMKSILSITKGETFALPENFDKETRDIFKSMFMKGYFDKSVPALVNHVINSIMGPEQYRLSEEDYEAYKAECTAIAKFIFGAYVKAINQAIGKTYDSEVFLHESCIYMEVAKVIRDRGIKLVQIYDGFYTDKEVKDIEDIIKEVSERYYREHIIENIKNIENIDRENILDITKGETFAEEEIDPIVLLRNYTIFDVPYEVWSEIEPDWGLFQKNYGSLLNKKAI